MPGQWPCRNPLSLSERLKIEEGLKLNLSYRELGLFVGRCKSVVMKESKRLGNASNYNAYKAQEDFEYKMLRLHLISPK